MNFFSLMEKNKIKACKRVGEKKIQRSREGSLKEWPEETQREGSGWGDSFTEKAFKTEKYSFQSIYAQPNGQNSPKHEELCLVLCDKLKDNVERLSHMTQSHHKSIKA